MAEHQDIIRRKESITQLVRSKENVEAYRTVERKLLGKIMFLDKSKMAIHSKLAEINPYIFTDKLYRAIFEQERAIIVDNREDLDIADLDKYLSEEADTHINELYEKAGSYKVIQNLISSANGNFSGIEDLIRKLNKMAQKNTLINDTIQFLNELDLNQEPREVERNFLKISESLSQLNDDADNSSQPFKEILESWNQLIYEQRLSENNLGVDIGYPELDKKLGGIRPGQFIVLGARPGTGKTAFALNVIQNIIDNDETKNVLMFSLEMNSFELIERVVSRNTGINNRLIRTNQLTDVQWADISTYVNNNKDNVSFYIDDNPGLTIEGIETEINKVLEQVDQIDLVVIDYLQLISSPNENRQQAVANISRKSKLLAKKYHLPILSLSQLSRAGVANGMRPGLESLRESGQIEQDADIVMMLSPKEEKDDDDEYDGEEEQHDDSDNIAQITCDVVKNRSGNRGAAQFIFHKDISLFKEDAEAKKSKKEIEEEKGQYGKDVNIGDLFEDVDSFAGNKDGSN